MSDEAKDFMPMDTVTYFRPYAGANVTHMPRMAIGEVIKRCGTKTLLVKFRRKDGSVMEKMVWAKQLEKGRRYGAVEEVG